MDKQIILAGLPGDMGTLIKDIVESTKGLKLAKLVDNQYTVFFPAALTGTKIKDKVIDEEFIHSYLKNERIRLIPPKDHEKVLEKMKEDYKEDLYGINFATAEGYSVNHLFAERDIPFISGVTGASPEKESELVKAVQSSDTCAIIDKNMSAPLIIFGSMLKYAAEKFPGALKGYTGYGIDEHQETKKDPISGTLVKWQKAFEKLGVKFYSANGSRQGGYGHADHFIRVSSPKGDVKLNFMTEVLGRDTYAQGTIESGLSFLATAINMKKKGKVYSMEDALSIQF